MREITMTVRIPEPMMERLQKALDSGLCGRTIEEAVERLAAEGLRHFIVPLDIEEFEDGKEPWA